LLKDLLILLAILILLIEIYRKLHQTWLQHQLSCKKKAKRPRKAAVLRPKSERDCRFCQEDKRKKNSAERENQSLEHYEKVKVGRRRK